MKHANERAPRELGICENVELAGFTTLGLGGPARYFVAVETQEKLVQCLLWSQENAVRTLILGGGSNLVIADDGFDGLVIHLGLRGIRFEKHNDELHVDVGASEPWDEFVLNAVQRGLAGIECLSGIPGSVGATPIQNVGAYGQEVSDVIESVQLWDRTAARTCQFERDQCEFAYRDSRFKRTPHRFVVLSVRFALRPNDACVPRYSELAKAMAGKAPTLANTRDAVLALRRSKSMVFSAADPDSHSVGSFFTNPILSQAEVEAVAQLAVTAGIISARDELPSFAMPPASVELSAQHQSKRCVKLPAAWLIERAGIARGLRCGGVGVSNKHTLALVHYGGGTTRELVDLALSIRDRVHDVFGVTLVPEPQLVGVTWTAGPT